MIDFCVPLENFIKTLNKISDFQDVDTKDHSRRTRTFCSMVGGALGFEGDELLLLTYGADIHDVGKLAVESSILRQGAKLTPSQRVSMRKHCEYGLEIVQFAKLPPIVNNCILYHQEHWDGSGYPFGLREEAIPLEARIVCLADVWDAINSDRPYRASMPEDKAMAFMNKHHLWFDPRVFAAWLRLKKEGLV